MAVCQRNTTNNFTDFQQNTITVDNPPAGEPNEFGETAADMFLNWVYRTQNLGGFANVDWRPNSIVPNSAPVAYCNQNGCADSVNPGDLRFNWMNTNINAIFNVQGW
jgi:hypothetical protein